MLFLSKKIFESDRELHKAELACTSSVFLARGPFLQEALNIAGVVVAKTFSDTKSTCVW